MNKTTSVRGGWSEKETELLLSRANAARQSGVPLRQVFCEIARTTGRKPNSIRNYYYLKAKEEGVSVKSAFVPFGEDEVRSLLREILKAQGAGISVRRAALDIGGDEQSMLRIQNKYRSVVRGRRELVCDIMRELEDSGCAYVNPYTTVPLRGRRPSCVKPADAASISGIVSEQKKCSAQYRSMQQQIAELNERVTGLNSMISHMMSINRELMKKDDAIG